EPQVGRQGLFTKFSHAPHLNVAQLADCTHCHRVRSPQAEVAVNVASLVEFEPLGRNSCASCHTRRAAGDACTKCHRYHIDYSFTLPALSADTSQSSQTLLPSSTR
ncbi:MAG: hypothetical protein MI861_28620, partial [Pirellulales bacterium]|nr:hypothetical protein [Pirellulales bacterium]